MSGDAGSIASRWPTGKVQEEALRVTPRVDRSELVGRIAVAEVLAPDPLGRCCSPTTTPPGNWALSTSVSCRPWRPSASPSRWWASGTQAMWCKGAIGTPPPTRPACAAGAGYSLWVARACATRMLGRASTPGPRAHVLGAQPAGDRWQLAAGARTTHRLHHGALQRTWSYLRRLLLQVHLRGAHLRHWASDPFGGVADLAVRTPGPMFPS